MLVERKEHFDEDGTLGWIESVFDSSNVLASTYFPKKEKLYISFNRGGVYSYMNVTEEMYEEFENADSQGLFFSKNIRNNEKHPYFKEFTLYESEIKEANKKREAKKKKEEDDERESD